MNNKFTVEESNLISIYAREGARSRKEVIKSISEIIEHLNEDEMIELSFQVLVKLNDMSDNEFAEQSWEPAVEMAENENLF